jgi:hypothetical protein
VRLRRVERPALPSSFQSRNYRETGFYLDSKECLKILTLGECYYLGFF